MPFVEFWRRLASLLHSRRWNSDLEEEMRLHIELRTQALRAAGMTAEEAEQQARRRFGNATLLKEVSRDMWAWASIETTGQDLRYAARQLRRNPGFATAAVITLALAIAGTTAVFALVDSTLLCPLPYRDSARLVALWQKIPQEPRVNFSPREMPILTSPSPVFEDIAASVGNGYTVSGQGDAFMLLCQVATVNLFSVLGANAAIGRTFTAEDGKPGHDHVMVLSYATWRERFNADPTVVSRSIVANGEPFTVVGVMPPNFSFPDRNYQAWVPAVLSTDIFKSFPDAHFLRIVARTRGQVRDSAIWDALHVMESRIAEQDPSADRKLVFAKLQDLMTAQVRRPLLLLMFAVVCLLLIASVNVANLHLARASARQKELAIRGALGAGRIRIARQLLAESILIAIAGGAAGFIAAVIALRSLPPARMEGVSGLVAPHFDWKMFAFASLVSLAVGLLFGLAPAAAQWRERWNEPLRQRSAASGPFASRLRMALVMVQLALAVVLTAVAGVMIHSFALLEGVNPGFQPARVLSATLAMPEARYPDANNIFDFQKRLLANVRSIPGVEAAATTTALPFSGQGWGNGIQVEGHPAPNGKNNVAQIECISTGYLQSLGIPLKRGRDFDERDRRGGLPVAMISESAARRFWPNEDPIGKRVEVEGPWRLIVGIAGDVKKAGLDESGDPLIYLPYSQLDEGILKFVGRGLFVTMRSVNDPRSLVADLRTQVRALDPSMALSRVAPLDTMLSSSLAQPRLRTTLVTAFSTVGLLLACVGVYGVVSYSVTQRSKEIGIRIALGATRTGILRDVLSRIAGVSVIGVLAGLAIAFAVTRSIQGLLFGVAAHDPLTFFAAPLLLLMLAFAAGFIPARSASRIDPVDALRQE